MNMFNDNLYRNKVQIMKKINTLLDELILEHTKYNKLKIPLPTNNYSKHVMLEVYLVIFIELYNDSKVELKNYNDKLHKLNEILIKDEFQIVNAILN